MRPILVLLSFAFIRSKSLKNALVSFCRNTRSAFLGSDKKNVLQAKVRWNQTWNNDHKLQYMYLQPPACNYHF